MHELILPSITMQGDQGPTSTYHIEPLEPGFGFTLGSALCRALVRLPGLAITGLRIHGWRPEETGPYPGMKETLAELALNCKQIRVRSAEPRLAMPCSLLLDAE